MELRGHRFDWFLLYPLLCPAVLLAANNDAFGFDPPGWLDSFMYLGYFWHYPEHLWVFDDNSNYKISRLPWVLPGFVAHSLFSPATAGRLLAYGGLTSAAVALYLHVRDAIEDRHAAAFVSVLLACCTGMHAPGGWYYQALPAAGFYLWACWLLTRAASSDRHAILWAAAAGICFAAAVHTHVFLAVFAPLLLMLYWGALREREHAWPRIASATLAALVGGVLLTVVLAVVNRLTGGEWLFFMPQLELAVKLSEHDRWWLPAGQWLPGATYLVLPLALIATGLSSGYLLFKPEQRLKSTLVILPCVALALTCVFQFWTRETTLDYDYMAFVLYLHAFPAAAVAVSRAEDPGRRPLAILPCVTAIVLGALLFLMPTALPAFMTRMAERMDLARLPGIVAPLVFSIAGVAVARVTPRNLRMVVVAAWFSIANAWIAPQAQAYGLRTPGVRRAMLETFAEADDFTHRLDPTLIGIKYWLSSETLATSQGPLQAQQVFDSFLATRAWFTNLFARNSPGLPIDTLTREHLERASCVAILSSRERQAPLAEQMMTHYASLERPLRVVATRTFQRGELAFALTVLKPVDRPAVGAPCSSNADAR